MAKKYVNKAVYDALWGIADEKRGYETKKSSGTDGYQAHQANAVPMYDVVKQYSPELYHTLQNSDYKTTLDVLKGYEVQPSRNANDVLTDIYGYKVGYEGKLAKGDPSYQQMHYDAQPFYAELDAVDPSLSAMAHGMNATELKEYLDSLTPPKTDYTPSEAMSSASDTFLRRGDAVSRNIDTMYFDEDYGKSVRDNYTRYGTAKSGQAAAGTAADNGGNYDSFSNYNRDLTDMQYRIAGDNAVQAMREGYAKGQTQFFDVWGNAVNTSNANFADYDEAVQQIGASERMANADNLVDMYGYDRTLEGQKYVSDNDLLGVKDTNATKLTAEQIAADADKAVASTNAYAKIATTGKEGTSNTNPTYTETEIMQGLHKAGIKTEQGAKDWLKMQGYDDEHAKSFAKDYINAIKVDDNGDNAFSEGGDYYVAPGSDINIPDTVTPVVNLQGERFETTKGTEFRNDFVKRGGVVSYMDVIDAAIELYNLGTESGVRDAYAICSAYGINLDDIIS